MVIRIAGDSETDRKGTGTVVGYRAGFVSSSDSNAHRMIYSHYTTAAKTRENSRKLQSEGVVRSTVHPLTELG